MPNQAEIAWAAGLFEGEGCFEHSVKTAVANHSTGRVGRYAHFRVTIQMTDRDVLERFCRIVEIGKVAELKPRTDLNHIGRKTMYKWATTSNDHFRQVYALFEPWLCERRRARGAEILIALDEYQARGYGRTAHAAAGA